ncbi:MAG: flavodoxin family protein [Candidatus Tectomicrobia bacterium]|uniref:Flavodoxin family protein n=1 Tax=Tectimicrobiota bacterium TaxID=2528274 RepID=A0A933GLB7_UNCTE|nr:flavodoxin family protein [Candidatus Tectomicrobia bacterium]
MLVLGIAASPRRSGNSEVLLDEALRGAQAGGAKIVKVVLQELRIAPCLECYSCHQHGECIVRDDMTQLAVHINECDGLILASPIFFYGVSAQAKAMIDRCQSFWAQKYLLKRPERLPKRLGFFISTAGSGGEKTFFGATLTVRYFFDAIGFSYWNDLLVKHVDNKGAILERPDMLEKAFNLGLALVTELANSEKG